ncbi:hypothetical protein PCANC_14626 [Puccinia coronata f. sp. avenae]|uniref:Uncharacterized protein n=1 Tax=Puccinia coronata f. sp. avenae TaxID=200324 RepID=A0A2N5SV38_9BASI|nr:hypothetical protein PCANC_14626 [Puccinia coronata f. sp. avenae]
MARCPAGKLAASGRMGRKSSPSFRGSLRKTPSARAWSLTGPRTEGMDHARTRHTFRISVYAVRDLYRASIDGYHAPKPRQAKRHRVRSL